VGEGLADAICLAGLGLGTGVAVTVGTGVGQQPAVPLGTGTV
jgi:hypothetical protein